MTIAGNRRLDTAELADQMREAGMTVDAVLGTVGVVTGTASPTQATAVAALPVSQPSSPTGPCTRGGGVRTTTVTVVRGDDRLH
ncbi:hypothetical protein GCM10023199_44640 [Actinomycetospora chibensis]